MVNLLTKLSNINVNNIWSLVKKVKTESLYEGNADVDCKDYNFQTNPYIAASMEKLGIFSVSIICDVTIIPWGDFW